MAQTGAEPHARKTPREILEAQGRLKPDVVAVRARDRLYDLHTPVAEDAELAVVRVQDPDALPIIRHSTAHVMADAVQRLFPGTKVAFGPATDAGFYYDFQVPKGAFTDDDLAAIEAEMKRIVAAKAPFRREVVSRDDARKLLADMKETFKAEHLERLPEGEDISIYRHGDGKGEWLDLCE